MTSRKNIISNSEFPVGCNVAADGLYTNETTYLPHAKSLPSFVLLKIVCRFLIKFTFAFTKQRAERLQNIAAAPLCIFSDNIQQRKTAPNA